MHDILRILTTAVLAGLAIAFFPWPFVWVFLLGSYFCLSPFKQIRPRYN